MHFGQHFDEGQSETLFVTFNQDFSSLAIGCRSGYRLLTLSAADRLEEIFTAECDDVCIVERLFSSSLVALVSQNAPRKLKVCHFKKGTEICNYSYSNTILAVRLNRLRLVVCLEESLYIHNIRDMKVLHTIRDTPSNSRGLCALSASNDNCFLAYPGSSQVGEVQVFDAVALRAVTMIPAHDSPLAALTFNAVATRLATASEKGTVIRVFSIPDGQRIAEYRRGVRRCVTIHSLAFSWDSAFLAATSNTETVHVFSLDSSSNSASGNAAANAFSTTSSAAAVDLGSTDTASSNRSVPQTWMDWATTNTMKYFPVAFSSQDRAFATARLPGGESAGVTRIAICALTVIGRVPRLLVATSIGKLHVYNLDIREGGECQHVSELSLYSSSGLLSVGGANFYSPVRLPVTHEANQSTIDRSTTTAEMASPDSMAFAGLKLDDENEFPPVG